MKIRFIVPAAAVALALSVPAALPATAAPDARAEMVSALETTRLANANGYAYVYDDNGWHAEVGALGARLGTTDPRLTEGWSTSPLGSVVTRADKSGGGKNYKTYATWKAGEYYTAPAGFLDKVDAAASAAGVTEDSYVLVQNLSGPAWVDMQLQWSSNEPTLFIESALTGWTGTPVSKTTTQAGVEFSMVNENGTAVLSVDSNGLVTSLVSSMNYSIVLTAYGDSAVAPDIAIADSDVVRQAASYLDDSRVLREGVIGAVAEAKAAARAQKGKQKGKVTVGIMTKALRNWDLLGPNMNPQFRTKRSGSTFTIRAVDTSFQKEYGQVCAKVTPRGKNVRVVYC